MYIFKVYSFLRICLVFLGHSKDEKIILTKREKWGKKK